MKLRLDVSESEIGQLCEAYKNLPWKPRQKLKKYVIDEILGKLSQARSMKGDWAVRDTIKPAVEEAVDHYLPTPADTATQ
jgi:hypothetical protein